MDVLLTDKKGNRVNNQDRIINFEIEGPAKILALESADLDSHENYQTSQRKTYKGKLRAYIKTTKGEDDLVIRINDTELITQKVKIKNINK